MIVCGEWRRRFSREGNKMSRTKTKLKLKPEPVSDEVITPMNNTELLPFGTGTKLLRLDIPLTDEFLEVVTEL
jgi:hypothetical protein